MGLSEFLLFFKWWGVFFLIGISFLPLTNNVFSKFLDKGYLFSKVIGIILISYTIYLLSSLHLLKFSPVNIIAVWILLTAVIWFLFRKSLVIKKTIKIFLLEEIIFFSTLLIWSVVRGFQPAIHDLEKFMDFGFLNSILRAEYFPPRDMWFTPLSINYYYFGHLITAVLSKISAIPSFVSFNLMMATLFAFTFSLSFSLGVNLIRLINFSIKKSLLVGFVTAFLVTLAGNLQTIYSFFSGYNAEAPVPFWNLVLSLPTFPNSYWYPNATRFIFHTIHEFPSYSFVVADLHGHVLSIPIVLTTIALLFQILINQKINRISLLLLPLLLASAYMTNAWDGLIYLGLSGLSLFCLYYFKLRKLSIKNRLIDATYESVKWFVPIVILFFLFSFVFNKNFTPFASGIGFICSPDFLVKIGKIGPIIFEEGQCAHSPFWQLGILYGFFIFMLGSFLIFLRKKTLLVADQIVIVLSFISLVLITIPEFFYLKDIYTGYFRANTMFKLSYQAFIMFSISSGYILFRIISSVKQFKTIPAKVGFYSFLSIGGVLLFFVSIYPYFSIPSGYGNLKKYRGLDGISYLKEIKPYDYEAINWLNKNISGQPIILEAQGDSYTDFGRISANTGLPTLLGWTVHEWLWRGSYNIPAGRFDDIRNLYETTEINLTKKLIDKYNISYIYIGVLEEEKYKINETNENKFAILGELVYSNPGVKIYKIR